MTTLASVGTLTKAGLSLLVAAQVNGVGMPVSAAKVSSDVLACTGDETSMPDVVYTATGAPGFSASQPQQGVLRGTLYLSPQVGTFDIGTVGLYSGTTLFALAAFPGAGSKIASDPPTTAGNLRQFIVDVPYLGRNPFQFVAGPVSGVGIAAALLAGGTATITVRQLRSVLASGLPSVGLVSNSNGTLNTALAAHGADDAVGIQASVGLLTTIGDDLYNLVRTTFGLTAQQMATLYTVASGMAP